MNVCTITTQLSPYFLVNSKENILLQEMLRKCKHMSLIKFWIYHDDFGLSDTFWFIIIMKKKCATGLIIKLFWSKDACTKEPSFPFAFEISHWNYSRSKKIENIHPSNYSKIMRLVYRHILNISLINRTFCNPFLQGEEDI